MSMNGDKNLLNVCIKQQASNKNFTKEDAPAACFQDLKQRKRVRDREREAAGGRGRW